MPCSTYFFCGMMPWSRQNSCRANRIPCHFPAESECLRALVSLGCPSCVLKCKDAQTSSRFRMSPVPPLRCVYEWGCFVATHGVSTLDRIRVCLSWLCASPTFQVRAVDGLG